MGWALRIARALGLRIDFGVGPQPEPLFQCLSPAQDFHSHLTRSEVVGYLGGRWDINSQSGYLGPSGQGGAGGQG